ncbi:hypothetical protein CN285_25045 [Bacillus cereus]|uniref:hypothetical protein n=1 Tax=Bacillus paramycoides TaxID=2026194 RepID=UPI000BF44D4C|nr:hypothetical protein [Bacillus paramycoides]PFD34682.1 hypothetical protein CN285_25045 [Bacillus cereus]PGM50965.1 hypothetical protein CN947_27640 [Bacillus cereus]
MEKIADILLSHIDALSEEEQKVMKKLISKLKSFAHAPLNKNHCLRMKPFIESEGVTKLVANTVQSYKLNLMPNSHFSMYDVIGYNYSIALLTCCVAFEKDNFKQVYSVLENEVKKENEKNVLISERGGENYYVMARILKFFKKDAKKIDSLFSQLIILD